MILNSDLPLKTEYDTATNIIQVSIPDLSHFTMSELINYLNAMTDTIRTYHIQKVLFECYGNSERVGGEDGYTTLCQYIGTALGNTKVQRVARLQSSDTVCERIVQQCIQEHITTSMIPFTTKTFKTKTDALAWLKD